MASVDDVYWPNLARLRRDWASLPGGGYGRLVAIRSVAVTKY